VRHHITSWRRWTFKRIVVFLLKRDEEGTPSVTWHINMMTIFITKEIHDSVIKYKFFFDWDSNFYYFLYRYLAPPNKQIISQSLRSRCRNDAWKVKLEITCHLFTTCTSQLQRKEWRNWPVYSYDICYWYSGDIHEVVLLVTQCVSDIIRYIRGQ
jgi:hypothetical protein